MVFGSITGIIHGISLPLLMLVFGDLINFFIYQEHTSILASCFNVSRNCDDRVMIMNSELNTLRSCVSGTQINTSLVNGLPLGTIFPGVFGDVSRCISDDQFSEDVQLQSIYFVIIAVGVFFFAYIQISFFQMACERQVRKIRLFFYRAILRQNIGWFDSNPSGELASRLNE